MEELVPDMILSLLKDNLGTLASAGRQGGARVREEFLIATGRAFHAYYERARVKYGVTKTLLYRTTPVPLYDFYVHLELAGAGGERLKTVHVSQLLLRAPHVLITGTAGTGKSTLLRHFFLDALNAGQYLPLFFELRDVNDHRDTALIEVIRVKLATLGLEVTRDALVRLLLGGRVLLLLDGFDEVDTGLARHVQKEILELRDQYPKSGFVVSSRPDYRFVGWTNFSEFPVLPLSKEQVLELIANLKYDPTTADSFRRAIKEGLYETHQSFVENPLLVTLMLLAFDHFAEIPGKQHLFYAQAFDTLYRTHDATKGYLRDLLSTLASDDFQDVLSAFSILSYLDGQIEFSRPEVLDYLEQAAKVVGETIPFDRELFFADLQRAVCVLLQDGLRYVYSHRSFQEYFAARFIVRCSPQHRTLLLRKIEPRAHKDAVLRLAWEIDRRAVEEDYLFDRLSAAGGGFDDPSPEDALITSVRQWANYIFLDSEDAYGINISDHSLFAFFMECATLYCDAEPRSLLAGSRLPSRPGRLNHYIRKTYPGARGRVALRLNETGHPLDEAQFRTIDLDAVSGDPNVRALLYEMLRYYEPLLVHGRIALQKIRERRSVREMWSNELLFQ
jgi:hypothetical protein